MMEAYGVSLVSLAAMAVLMLVQVIVADVVGIARRHVPGTPTTPNHADLLFRASRVVGNTNESIAIFLCALLLCLFTQASPFYTGVAAWVYVVCRTAYAVCYYANLPTFRSAVFALSLVALLAMIVVGLIA